MLTLWHKTSPRLWNNVILHIFETLQHCIKTLLMDLINLIGRKAWNKKGCTLRCHNVAPDTMQRTSNRSRVEARLCGKLPIKFHHGMNRGRVAILPPTVYQPFWRVKVLNSRKPFSRQGHKVASHPEIVPKTMAHVLAERWKGCCRRSEQMRLGGKGAEAFTQWIIETGCFSNVYC